MNGKGYRTFEAPNPIREKAVKGSGVDLDTVQKRVEQAFDGLRDEYGGQLRKDLAAIDEALAGARDASEAGRRQALDRIYRVSHDIRGQAGTFGYPLITIIGTSLCNFIRKVTEIGSPQLKAIEIHTDAMRAVIAHGISGDGGAVGQELVENMTKLVAKTLDR